MPKQPSDRVIHERFLLELDGIIENAADFIKDDGPHEAPAHVADFAAAMHIRRVWIEDYSPYRDDPNA